MQARDFAVSGKEGQKIIWAHSRILGASASWIVGGKKTKRGGLCRLHYPCRDLLQWHRADDRNLCDRDIILCLLVSSSLFSSTLPHLLVTTASPPPLPPHQSVLQVVLTHTGCAFRIQFTKCRDSAATAHSEGFFFKSKVCEIRQNRLSVMYCVVLCEVSLGDRHGNSDVS